MTTVIFCMIGLIVMVILGPIIFIVVKIQSQRAENNGKPVLSEHARIVTKRPRTGGGNIVSTSYYVTFELPTGERREFSVKGDEYGMLVENDEGLLTYQGTRYMGFQRLLRQPQRSM